MIFLLNFRTTGILVIFAFYSGMFGQGFVQLINEKIYGLLNNTLTDKYPNQTIYVNCLVKYFREIRFADEFYSFKLIIDSEKFMNETIKPKLLETIDAAQSKCVFEKLISSKLGICIMVITLLTIICLIYLLLRIKQFCFTL